MILLQTFAPRPHHLIALHVTGWDKSIPTQDGSGPSSSIQPPSISAPFPPSLPFLVPHGLRKRARVRSCVGMAVCLIEGVGPLGVSGELHEFVMSAMLAMAY